MFETNPQKKLRKENIKNLASKTLRFFTMPTVGKHLSKNVKREPYDVVR